MGCQFIHIETYSRESSKISKKTSSGSVISEALRKEGFTDHIEAPEAPKEIYTRETPPEGISGLEFAYKSALEKLETEKDSMGRKIRSDANILLAGVASFPKPLISMIDKKTGKTDTDELQRYEMWKIASLEFLKKEYGDNLGLYAVLCGN